MNVFLVFSTVPNHSAARKIARTLLIQHLAACAYFTPLGESHYWWKGEIEKSKEILIIFKTSKKALPSLMRTLKQVHPYETPEILATRVDQGSASYLRWLVQETR